MKMRFMVPVLWGFGRLLMVRNIRPYVVWSKGRLHPLGFTELVLHARRLALKTELAR